MDPRVPCRAVCLDGLICGRLINPQYVQCGKHGDNPMIIEGDVRDMLAAVLVHRNRERGSWIGASAPLLSQEHNYEFTARLQDESKPEDVFKSSQTVHASPITESAKKGLRALLAMDCRSLSPVESLELIAPAKWGFLSKHFRLRRHIKSLYANEFKIYDQTFQDVFCVACSIIKSKRPAERKLLIMRVRQELNDGIGYCLQGNITRLINAFSGLVEGVQVGLSTGDQLQIRMGRISSLNEPVEKKKALAQEALKELEVPSEQWSAWIDAMS